MKNKQIIIIIGIIFIALIGYKLISSNIQENKEKAVIDYRIQAEQFTKNQENENKKKQNDDCLNNSTIKSAKDKDFIFKMARCWGVGTLVEGSLDDCIAKNGMGRKECQTQEGVCLEQINQKLSIIDNELTKAKEECYKRYK